MPDLLVRPARTQFTEQLADATFFLLVAAGLCLFLQLSWTASATGLLITFLAGLWKVKRIGAVQHLPARRCGMPRKTEIQRWVWRVCILGGPILFAFGQHQNVRIAGLVLIACGVAVVFSHHSCRFSAKCHPRDMV